VWKRELEDEKMKVGRLKRRAGASEVGVLVRPAALLCCFQPPQNGTGVVRQPNGQRVPRLGED
jgi:hypothetical protein